MFPKILDGAEVLYYTPYDNFGEIYWDIEVIQLWSKG